MRRSRRPRTRAGLASRSASKRSSARAIRPGPARREPVGHGFATAIASTISRPEQAEPDHLVEAHEAGSATSSRNCASQSRSKPSSETPRKNAIPTMSSSSGLRRIGEPPWRAVPAIDASAETLVAARRHEARLPHHERERPSERHQDDPAGDDRHAEIDRAALPTAATSPAGATSRPARRRGRSGRRARPTSSRDPGFVGAARDVHVSQNAARRKDERHAPATPSPRAGPSPRTPTMAERGARVSATLPAEISKREVRELECRPSQHALPAARVRRGRSRSARPSSRGRRRTPRRSQ